MNFFTLVTARCKAPYCYRMSSVCLSVCLSVCDVGGSWPHRL